MGGLAHVVPKTPPRKMCQKPHPEKTRFDWKSQGQIFQECQGQIPRLNISGMPRSNPMVKNVWNVWNVWNVKTKKWENGKKKYKILKNLWKIIFENFVI